MLELTPLNLYVNFTLSVPKLEEAMPTGQKSPLHPSALTINGLTVGRTILRFNRHHGEQGLFIVMERPRVRATMRGSFLMVRLKSVLTGKSSYHHLSDLGVVSSRGVFSEQNFVVDHRKRHLLPTELVPQRPYIGRLA
jgi:hypothetical protein